MQLNHSDAGVRRQSTPPVASDEHQTDRAAIATLADDVLVTLHHDGDGWGFHDWTSSTFQLIITRPILAHRALRFATVDQAVQFFRSAYVEHLDPQP